MFSTEKSNNRIDALNLILNKQENIIAYLIDGSGCSCCLSEYFDIIVFDNNMYTLYRYSAYQKHLPDCALIRCSCNSPFIWKNISPNKIEKSYFINLDSFTPTVCETDWKNHMYNYKIIMEQMQENEEIEEYIKKCEYQDYEFLGKKNILFYNKNK